MAPHLIKIVLPNPLYPLLLQRPAECHSSQNTDRAGHATTFTTNLTGSQVASVLSGATAPRPLQRAQATEPTQAAAAPALAVAPTSTPQPSRITNVTVPAAPTSALPVPTGNADGLAPHTSPSDKTVSQPARHNSNKIRALQAQLGAILPQGPSAPSQPAASRAKAARLLRQHYRFPTAATSCNSAKVTPSYYSDSSSTLSPLAASGRTETPHVTIPTAGDTVSDLDAEAVRTGID